MTLDADAVNAAKLPCMLMQKATAHRITLRDFTLIVKRFIHLFNQNKCAYIQNLKSQQ